MSRKKKAAPRPRKRSGSGRRRDRRGVRDLLMKVKGGNTDALYRGDGRLRMARSLERQWPGVVTTRRKFNRPQHHIRDSWAKFDTPLLLRPGIDPENPPPFDEDGMELVIREDPVSRAMKGIVAAQKAAGRLRRHGSRKTKNGPRAS